MDANERELVNNLIEKVIGAVYEVANVLGAGFLEKVYERALLNRQLNMCHPRMLLSGIWFRKTGFPLKQCGNDKRANVTNLIAGVIVKELGMRGLHAEAQVPIQVSYKDESVGDYYADILVERKLIVELKCAERLGNDHLAQCLNYLKATGHGIALLVNFQHPKVEWKRVVYNF